MIDPTLLSRSAIELAGLLDTGELTAVELLEQSLAAVDAVNPTINAYLHVDLAGAQAAAAASDERRAAKQLLGPFDGVPAAVKDNIDVAGMPCTAGLAARRDYIPNADACVVQQLRDAGLIVVGKLNMEEAALGATNNNLHFGACHNPHRSGFTPGGSSGGSAAAVAAGLAALTLGTDTMGSCRIPAAYCGVVGFKPSFGLLSTRGSVAVSHRLDHIGPLARSAGDLLALLPKLSRFDQQWPYARRYSAPSKALTQCAVRLVNLPVDSVIDNAVQRVFELARDVVSDADQTDARLVGFGPMRRAGLLLSEAEMLVEHQQLLQEHRSTLSPMLERLLSFAEGKSAADLARARRLVDEGLVVQRELFCSADFLVMPSTPQSAFSFDDETPANQADWTSLANFSGYPAISIPAGTSNDGLPIGVQLVARPGDDLRLLALATAVEQQLAIPRTLPAPIQAMLS